jgi:hypothetical protein
MLKTVFTMWRLVFGSKRKNNKTRRNQREREEKTIKKNKIRKEQYLCEGE